MSFFNPLPYSSSSHELFAYLKYFKEFQQSIHRSETELSSKNIHN